MWFLLLIALASGEHSAHSVHASEQECVKAMTTAQDVCVAVRLNIVKLPPTNPITATELPPIETGKP